MPDYFGQGGGFFPQQRWNPVQLLKQQGRSTRQIDSDTNKLMEAEMSAGIDGVMNEAYAALDEAELRGREVDMTQVLNDAKNKVDWLASQVGSNPRHQKYFRRQVLNKQGVFLRTIGKRAAKINHRFESSSWRAGFNRAQSGHDPDDLQDDIISIGQSVVVGYEKGYLYNPESRKQKSASEVRQEAVDSRIKRSTDSALSVAMETGDYDAYENLIRSPVVRENMSSKGMQSLLKHSQRDAKEASLISAGNAIESSVVKAEDLENVYTTADFDKVAKDKREAFLEKYKNFLSRGKLHRNNEADKEEYRNQKKAFDKAWREGNEQRRNMHKAYALIDPSVPYYRKPSPIPPVIDVVEIMHGAGLEPSEEAVDMANKARKDQENLPMVVDYRKRQEGRGVHTKRNELPPSGYQDPDLIRAEEEIYDGMIGPAIERENDPVKKSSILLQAAISWHRMPNGGADLMEQWYQAGADGIAPLAATIDTLDSMGINPGRFALQGKTAEKTKLDVTRDMSKDHIADVRRVVRAAKAKYGKDMWVSNVQDSYSEYMEGKRTKELAPKTGANDPLSVGNIFRTQSKTKTGSFELQSTVAKHLPPADKEGFFPNGMSPTSRFDSSSLGLDAMTNPFLSYVRREAAKNLDENPDMSSEMAIKQAVDERRVNGWAGIDMGGTVNHGRNNSPQSIPGLQDQSLEAQQGERPMGGHFWEKVLLKELRQEKYGLREVFSNVDDLSKVYLHGSEDEYGSVYDRHAWTVHFKDNVALEDGRDFFGGVPLFDVETGSNFELKISERDMETHVVALHRKGVQATEKQAAQEMKQQEDIEARRKQKIEELTADPGFFVSETQAQGLKRIKQHLRHQQGLRKQISADEELLRMMSGEGVKSKRWLQRARRAYGPSLGQRTGSMRRQAEINLKRSKELLNPAVEELIKSEAGAGLNYTNKELLQILADNWDFLERQGHKTARKRR